MIKLCLFWRKWKTRGKIGILEANQTKSHLPAAGNCCIDLFAGTISSTTGTIQRRRLRISYNYYNYREMVLAKVGKRYLALFMRARCLLLMRFKSETINHRVQFQRWVAYLIYGLIFCIACSNNAALFLNINFPNSSFG